MNRVYKVIYNRARNLYQVVSEIVHSRGKTRSLTAQHQHERLTTAVLIALLTMSTSLPVSWADPTPADPTTSELANALAAETQARTAADNEQKNNLDAETQARTAADNEQKNNLEAETQARIAADNNQKSNLEAETTARTAADNEQKSNLATETKNRTDADTAINNRIDTLNDRTDPLYKYFKVKPSVTTAEDGTKTEAPDAAANGTNSVAIGPSAQAGEKSTDTSTATTTVTGGTSSAAIGDSAKANGDQSVALGANAQVLNTTNQAGTTNVATGSTAIGSSATVNGASDATAIGTGAKVNEKAAGGIALGRGAVTGEAKEEITVDNLSRTVEATGGENSVAIGTEAKASGNTALALGNGAQVNNYTTRSETDVTKTENSGSTAIGNGAIVTGANDAVAFGSRAHVDGTGNDADGSMAFGKGAGVNLAKDSIAFGTDAQVASDTGSNAIAFGNGAKAYESGVTAIGSGAIARGENAIAFGTGAQTGAEGGIAIGAGTSVSHSAIAIGDSENTTAQNYNAIALGNGAQANANDSVSIGYQAGLNTSEGLASKYGSLIAIGSAAGSNVKGMQNVALGSGAGSNVKSSYNVAIGTNAGVGINNAAADDTKPQDGYNISIGHEANYAGKDAAGRNIANSIAIGRSANSVSNATALGYRANATGDKSMAMGDHATASDANSLAIGENASAAGGNIAIGGGSQAPAVTAYDSSYLTNNTTLNGYVSVGGKVSATTDAPILRRISNVADGAADQDAVTVAQLKAAYTDLEGTIKATDPSNDTYNKSAIDSKIATVNDKIDASKTKYFSVNTSSDTLTANADNKGASTKDAADAMAIGPNASATSAKAVAIGNNVSASGKGSIALGTADNPATNTTVTLGGNTSANPHVTSAEGANSVAIGTSAIAQADDSLAIGTRATVYTTDTRVSGTTPRVGYRSIAVGYQAETRNNDALSIGSGAKAYDVGSTAVGHNAFAYGADSVAIGMTSEVYGSNSGAVGKQNIVDGSDTYAVGSENKVNGDWGAVKNSGLYGNKNAVTPATNASGGTISHMDSLSVTGNGNTITQGSYADTVTNVSILGNGNKVTGGNTNANDAGVTSNITVIGGDNEVTGRDGYGSDINGKTWKELNRTAVIGYNNKVDQTTATTSLADTQILGNDVTATLGNSVYLGTGSSATVANSATDEAIQLAKQQGDEEALASDEYKNAPEDQKNAIMQKYEAKYIHEANVVAMNKGGSSAGVFNYDNDRTYGNDSTYTYAGSKPAGVVTVGAQGQERRVQNVAAGLVGPKSTDAVNGSQLYALTRQIRFGGDNSNFGTTTADDKNVVARGSNEAMSITGGEADSAKLTDNNIGVIADSTNNALSVKLASDLKKLHTASLGSGSGDTYKETIKLDGKGTNGGTLELKDKDGTNGVTLCTSGTTTTADVTGAATNRLLANDKTVATTDDGLKFGGDTGDDSALKLNNKLTVKGGETDTKNLTDNNIGVVSDGKGTLTVKLNKDVNLGNDGSLTTGTVTTKSSTGSSTLNTDGLTIANGPKFTNKGISANNQQIKNVTAGTDDTDAANFSQIKKATTTLTTGKNGNVNVTADSTAADGHTNYTIAVDDLAVKVTDGQKINGKTSVKLSDGLIFADGTNTTATVGDNGTIKYNVSNDAIKAQAKEAIQVQADEAAGNYAVVTADATDPSKTVFTVRATHNKLSTAAVTTGATDTSNAVTMTLNDADGNSIETTGLKDTYTVITKNNNKVTFKRNDGSKETVLSLNDFGAASKEDMNKATTEVRAGTNVTVGEPAIDDTDQHKIYTVNVDNLGLQQNGNAVGSGVSLKNGLNFTNGTNTTASVTENGTVSYNVSDDAIKAQAKNAVVVAAGDNVTIDGPTDVNNVKTYTVKLNKDINLGENGSVTTGNTVMNTNGLTIRDSADANKIKVAVTDGNVTMGGNVIHNVGDGVADKDAVNMSQLNKLQSQVNNSKWTLVGKDATGADVSAAISDGKQVTMGDGQYTKTVVSKGEDGNATVKVDVTTGTFGSGTGDKAGTVTFTADGLATTQDVANAINSASINVMADNTPNNKTAVKAGDTIHFDKDNNLTLTQNGTTFTYGLNKKINISEVTTSNSTKGSTVQTAEGITTKDAAGNTYIQHADRIILTSSDKTKSPVILTNTGLNNGNNVISGVAAGKQGTDAVNVSQLREAITTTQNSDQHIQTGEYTVGKNLDGTAREDRHSVSMDVVNGKGEKQGSVVIKDVAKASEVGDTNELSNELKKKSDSTSVVDAVNNLNDKVNTRVGDNKYSAITSKDPVQDGDSSTTAIGKLNNRMNDIYTTAGQHSSVSTADANLTLSQGKNSSGGTDYKIGLNKEHIDLGNVTINGNEGLIQSKSMKADSFTAGGTVVNNDGIKVGDKSALTGDSLKVGGNTYIDDKGINANNQQIRNVSDGKDDYDAVNVRQVNKLAEKQNKAINQNAANINQLDRAVNRLDSRINRVGAGAAALAALHPGEYDPDDKVDFSAGFGNYRGANAAAVGMFYHPDETTTMSVGASFGGGENMVNAGVTWKMGKGSGHMRTQAATKAVPVQFVTAPTPTSQTEGTTMPQPVKTVTTTASGQQVPIVAAYLPSVDNSTRAENDELKELLARQTAILEKLSDHKVATAQAAVAPVSGEDLFPDVPENHWAYDFVAKLQNAGALKGCLVEDPANNPMLTRNDFAQILYTALKNGATKNPALNNDGGLNHMANEFRSELKNVKR